MWIFTDTGFISAIAHYQDRGQIVARSRDRESLDSLAALADTTIHATPVRDYPFRVHVTRNVFTRWLSTVVADLEYTNFKDRVHVTRGERYHEALSGVWETMHHVEDREAGK